MSIGTQSPDIARGVDDAYEHREEGVDDALNRQGAGDQGLMSGYACQETDELRPLPITLAHRPARRLTRVRKDGTVPYLRPDGKTQVTVEYEGDRPVRLDTVVVSTRHAPGVGLKETPAPDIEREVGDRPGGRAEGDRPVLIGKARLPKDINQRREFPCRRSA